MVDGRCQAAHADVARRKARQADAFKLEYRGRTIASHYDRLPGRMFRLCAHELSGERTHGLSGGRATLLHPELIHSREGARIVLLELVPTIEIGIGFRGRKSRSESSDRRRIELEADECKGVLRKKCLDVGQSESMFLNVEQKIAAAAGAEEIPGFDNASHRSVVQAHRLLAKSSDVV